MGALHKHLEKIELQRLIQAPRITSNYEVVHMSLNKTAQRGDQISITTFTPRMTKFPENCCNLHPVITKEQVLEDITTTDGRTQSQQLGVNMYDYGPCVLLEIKKKLESKVIWTRIFFS